MKNKEVNVVDVRAAEDYAQLKFQNPVLE